MQSGAVVIHHSCSGPAMSSHIYCKPAPYQLQRAEFPWSYHQPEVMAYDTIRHVNDSYTFRVAPDVDLSVESYLPCVYTPSHTTSLDPRPRGAAIIFLHDFGASSYMFKRIINGCRCHCITVDFRGCGKSSRAHVSRLYSVQQMADDIEKLLPKLENVTDFILGTFFRRSIFPSSDQNLSLETCLRTFYPVDVFQGSLYPLEAGNTDSERTAGHGMGAKIAQIVASGEPEGLIGLALINPVPASPWILPRPKMERLYGSCESKTEALDFANGVLTARPGSVTTSDLDVISAHAITQDTALTLAWLGEGSEGKEGDWSVVLDRIKIPVVALAGTCDKLIGVETVRDNVYSKIYGCIMVQVEDAGHLLPLERPKKLLEELQAFVDACVDVRKYDGLRSGSLTYQGFCMTRESSPSNFMRTQGLE